MSNDNKTLADVLPGGRVRLATVPYDRARDLIGDAYNAGTHGIGYSQQAMELQDAIIPAQHSPGGQDALAALQQDYDKLLDSFNRQVEVAEKIAGRVLQQDDRIEELEEDLAARQPVYVQGSDELRARTEGERAAYMEGLEEGKKIAAHQPVTMDDALAAGDGTLHGAIDHWQERALRAEAELAARQPVGEIDEAAVLRRAAAVLDMWEGDSNQTGYMGDFKDAQAILEVLAQNAAPPAQAVDLGQFRDLAQRWADKADLAPSPMTARSCSQQLLALIDSKAVGK